jgi:xylan 1,4-beta-xylosidase
VQKHPSLRPELILNEWNMSLSNPVLDTRFQPAFILESAWQMKDAGLDYSCYYHIRDYHVELSEFTPFMSPDGAAAMARWWNRMPQYDGLFDYQNTMRPAYFAFKLLSRLVGSKLPVASDDEKVHAFFTWDGTYKTHNLLVWNYSDTPATVTLTLKGVDGKYTAHRRTLDAVTASNDENLRLRPLSRVSLTPGDSEHKLLLEPYGIEYWEITADPKR